MEIKARYLALPTCPDIPKYFKPFVYLSMNDDTFFFEKGGVNTGLAFPLSWPGRWEGEE
jgi:hypothetical protein